MHRYSQVDIVRIIKGGLPGLPVPKDAYFVLLTNCTPISWALEIADGFANAECILGSVFSQMKFRREN